MRGELRETASASIECFQGGVFLLVPTPLKTYRVGVQRAPETLVTHFFFYVSLLKYTILVRVFWMLV